MWLKFKEEACTCTLKVHKHPSYWEERPKGLVNSISSISFIHKWNEGNKRWFPLWRSTWPHQPARTVERFFAACNYIPSTSLFCTLSVIQNNRSNSGDRNFLSLIWKGWHHSLEGWEVLALFWWKSRTLPSFVCVQVCDIEFLETSYRSGHSEDILILWLTSSYSGSCG